MCPVLFLLNQICCLWKEAVNYMDSEKIGRFLKELRKGKGLTQERLSEKLGVTSRSISRWENGVNMPDLDLVIE